MNIDINKIGTNIIRCLVGTSISLQDFIFLRFNTWFQIRQQNGSRVTKVGLKTNRVIYIFLGWIFDQNQPNNPNLPLYNLRLTNLLFYDKGFRNFYKWCHKKYRKVSKKLQKMKICYLQHMYYFEYYVSNLLII